MSFPKILIIGAIALFGVIAAAAGVKKFAHRSSPISGSNSKKQENIAAVDNPIKPPPRKVILSSMKASLLPVDERGDLPQIDRISQLFTKGANKLPIVETLTYSSQVPWLKGKPAWIADYASYYGTSRHFIARSLNGKPDYFTQKVSAGSRFNVFRKDRNFQFYLLVDLSRCKMGFYYIDLDTNERILLKTYHVGLGKQANTLSGHLTPLGKYALGNKIAVYKPGVMGLFQDKQIEMVRAFGTRWIPFEQEIEGCTAPSKGFGIHGAPWDSGPAGQLVENRASIGTHDSDGSINMTLEDMEELFSIVITKPTIVEITKNFKEARLPGVEVASPMR